MEIDRKTIALPLRTLGTMLKDGKLKSEALTLACLARLEKLGPKLGAVVTVMRERALKEAKEADTEIKAGKWRGLLHGIPYAAKDLLAAKGAPTTWGAAPFKDRTFDFDAEVVKKLRAAGAVLTAKLSMIELAGSFGYESADSCFTGPCRSPWGDKRWAGGSSSGSGAAVAAALVPFSIGSETSGSIVTPASYCGITGLRPTHGRVGKEGSMPLSWTLDKLGPMARAANDCGVVLEAIAGRKYVHGKEEKRRWKIGVLRAATTGAAKAVADNFTAAVAALGKVADVEGDVALPDLPYSAALTLILRAEGATVFREFYESGEALKLRSQRMPQGGYAAQAVLATEYLDAMRARPRMRKAVEAVYAKYDAIIAPGTATLAPPSDIPFADGYPKGVGSAAINQLGTATNLLGQPCVCVPTGFSVAGLPTSMQVTGKLWSEGTLLAIARAYQEVTDWHARLPPEA